MLCFFLWPIVINTFIYDISIELLSLITFLLCNLWGGFLRGLRGRGELGVGKRGGP